MRHGLSSFTKGNQNYIDARTLQFQREKPFLKVIYDGALSISLLSSRGNNNFRCTA